MTAGSGRSAETHAQRGWCRAGSSAAWLRMLSQHIVARSRTAALVPLALAHDGHSFFAGAYSPRFSGVARIDARTGRLTRVKAFAHPRFDQAWAAFDGRWLVWNEYHGFDTFDDFTTWAWDTRSRKLTQLGAAVQGPTGQFWESPWRGPDARDGVATWVQGAGPDQLGDIHTYNLRTGRDLVVRHGHPGGAFLLDHHIVVWTEASAPGVPARMHAASALTGASAPLPRAFGRCETSPACRPTGTGSPTRTRPTSRCGGRRPRRPSHPKWSTPGISGMSTTRCRSADAT